MILSTRFDGESRELGRSFAAIAREVRKSDRPLKPPCALIGGGESIVTLRRNFGKGGPNQEFVAGAILNMNRERNFCIVGLDTDGTDGPTEAAGAIADASTLDRVQARGVDLQKALQDHTLLGAFHASDDLIFTGQTGTNVNDLKFLILK
jgi:glycerate-2-kinase